MSSTLCVLMCMVTEHIPMHVDNIELKNLCPCFYYHTSPIYLDKIRNNILLRAK